MQSHQYAEDRDLVKECLDQHYNKMLGMRQRVRINIEQFAQVTLVEATYGSKLQRDWFHKGAPVFTYWMTREQRQPVIERFFKAGFTITRIAQMLGFSNTTVGKDVRAMRESGVLPAEGHYREKPTLVRTKFSPDLPQAVDMRAFPGTIDGTLKAQQANREFAFEGARS